MARSNGILTEVPSLLSLSLFAIKQNLALKNLAVQVLPED